MPLFKALLHKAFGNNRMVTLETIESELLDYGLCLFGLQVDLAFGSFKFSLQIVPTRTLRVIFELTRIQEICIVHSPISHIQIRQINGSML